MEDFFPPSCFSPFALTSVIEKRLLRGGGCAEKSKGMQMNSTEYSLQEAWWPAAIIHCKYLWQHRGSDGEKQKCI